jgi:phosphoglycolate phosphatase
VRDADAALAPAPPQVPGLGAAPRITYGSTVLAYDHIVFDLDGTLIDSRADLGAAVNHTLRSFGLTALPLETVCQYVGEGARVLVQRSLGPEHEARLDEGLAVFLAYYGAHLLDHTRPYDGIAEVLAALTERGAVLSVLTNKPAALSRRILDGLGLLCRFAAVVGGDSLPARKPDPGGIDYLLETTHAARARTLLVGDSLIDMQTATAARVAFCGVTWGLRRADLVAAGIEWLIDRPGQLVRMVELGCG